MPPQGRDAATPFARSSLRSMNILGAEVVMQFDMPDPALWSI